jgi:hypothetical protein
MAIDVCLIFSALNLKILYFEATMLKNKIAAKNAKTSSF